MMTPDSLIVHFGMYATALACCTILGVIGLKGFRAWIELQRAKLGVSGPVPAPIGARIDVADLKERVRKLEAIAAGVDI
jgi:hypothetical protein